MSDKEKMKKAFQNLKAPEDTLERVMKKMQNKENQRQNGMVRKRFTLAIVTLLILVLSCGSVYAVKKFSLGSLFGQQSVEQEQKAAGNPATPENSMSETPADNRDFQISFPFEAESGVPEPKAAHDGVDFVADAGTPVLAAADGKVRTADFSTELGNYIVIDHAEGFSTAYACLAEMQVTAGDTVESGTQIGTVGSTGMATGPHLHLELWQDDVPLDPEPYLNGYC